MKLKTSRKPRPEPDLIPLINVVFLMLIFFLVAATLRPFSLWGIKPPQISGKSGAVQTHYAPLRLFFTRKHRFRLEGQRQEEQDLTLEELVSRLETAPNMPAKTPRPVTLIADKNLPAMAVLPLLERLQKLGFGDIKLVTEQTK